MSNEYRSKSNTACRQSMKRITAMAVIIGITICLAGCHSVKPEDIIEQYAAYAGVTEEENRLGIDMAGVKKVFTQQIVNVTFTNASVSQGNNINLLAPRFYAYNAENPEEEIELTYETGSSNIVLVFPEDMDCDYVVVLFAGIPESDVASIATPTCGFLVQIEKYGTKILSGPFVVPEIEN